MHKCSNRIQHVSETRIWLYMSALCHEKCILAIGVYILHVCYPTVAVALHVVWCLSLTTAAWVICTTGQYLDLDNTSGA